MQNACILFAIFHGAAIAFAVRKGLKLEQPYLSFVQSVLMLVLAVLMLLSAVVECVLTNAKKPSLIVMLLLNVNLMNLSQLPNIGSRNRLLLRLLQNKLFTSSTQQLSTSKAPSITRWVEAWFLLQCNISSKCHRDSS